MTRIRPTENILSDTISYVKEKITSTKRKRNYNITVNNIENKHKNIQFTNIDNITLPFIPGTCYHAIVYVLIKNKNKFISWKNFISDVSDVIRIFAGTKTLKKFMSKKNAKPYKDRIIDNVKILSRYRKHCCGYRLHKLGMVIFEFLDGLILYSDGKFTQSENKYTVEWSNGRSFQIKHNKYKFTYDDYLSFVNKKIISINCEILQKQFIKKNQQEKLFHFFQKENEDYVDVNVILNPNYDQETAYRFELYNFNIDTVYENELTGSIPIKNIKDLNDDKDVTEVKLIK